MIYVNNDHIYIFVVNLVRKLSCDKNYHFIIILNNFQYIFQKLDWILFKFRTERDRVKITRPENIDYLE